ncbi:MAG: RAD55 family ATPase [Candidatus Bathyarchaeota archaeon]|nr:RAD55 family ATPase [Candidatus Bathyarchaeota archaeon]
MFFKDFYNPNLSNIIDFYDKKYYQYYAKNNLTGAEYLTENVRTGIPGFDEITGGGFPSGSLILLYGKPGCGSSLFAAQVAYNRVTLEGKPVTYFLSYKSVKEVRREWAIFGWKLDEYVDKGLVKVVENFDSMDKVNLILEEIGKERWIILDSLSSLLIFEDSAKKVVKFLTEISHQAKKFGGLHFLLLTKDMHKPEVEVLVQHFVDGVMFFSFEVRGLISVRNMVILKMLGRNIPPDIIVFSIGENGLNIETATRIT